MVATVTPKKATPGGLEVGDVIGGSPDWGGNAVAVAEDIVTVVNPDN